MIEEHLSSNINKRIGEIIYSSKCACILIIHSLIDFKVEQEVLPGIMRCWQSFIAIPHSLYKHLHSLVHGMYMYIIGEIVLYLLT